MKVKRMGEQDYKPAGQDQSTDELDRVLDAALAQYSAVEPRAGLEDRVLANLRAQRTTVSERSWWRWGLAAALAAIVVVVALAWRSRTTTPPEIVKRPAIVVPDRSTSGTQIAHHDESANLLRPHPPAHKAAAHTTTAKEVVAANPKLDVFPSPHPMTEEERILATYVFRRHDQAILVAQASAEALRKAREEEQRQLSGNDGTYPQPQ